MMISLCAYLFDYAGDYLLDVDMTSSDISPLSRRVSRTATLDGGALLVDNGYSASDATFSLSLNDLSAADHAALSDTIKTHSLLILSCSLGCFLGAVERVDESRGFKIRFLVKKDLTQE